MAAINISVFGPIAQLANFNTQLNWIGLEYLQIIHVYYISMQIINDKQNKFIKIDIWLNHAKIAKIYQVISKSKFLTF